MTIIRHLVSRGNSQGGSQSVDNIGHLQGGTDKSVSDSRVEGHPDPHNKRKRRNKFSSKEKHESKLYDSPDSNTPFNIALLNVNCLAPDKWENLKQYLDDRNIKVDAYILSEHHLGSTETPSYIANDNYTMHITLGPKKKAIGKIVKEERFITETLLY